MVTIRTDDGFEWDEEKNTTNIRKHGIDFHDARRMFDGFVLTRLVTVWTMERLTRSDLA